MLLFMCLYVCVCVCVCSCVQYNLYVYTRSNTFILVYPPPNNLVVHTQSTHGRWRHIHEYTETKHEHTEIRHEEHRNRTQAVKSQPRAPKNQTRKYIEIKNWQHKNHTRGIKTGLAETNVEIRSKMAGVNTDGERWSVE